MKHSILLSAFLASSAFALAGCSVMPGRSSTGDTASSSTREQCRQQSAMIGTSGMRRDDTTARRDIDCATMMPN